MYMKNERPLHEISSITLIDRKDILAFVKRCLSYDDQGRIWGYRALIPRANGKWGFTPNSLVLLNVLICRKVWRSTTKKQCNNTA